MSFLVVALVLTVGNGIDRGLKGKKARVSIPTNEQSDWALGGTRKPCSNFLSCDAEGECCKGLHAFITYHALPHVFGPSWGDTTRGNRFLGKHKTSNEKSCLCSSSWKFHGRGSNQSENGCPSNDLSCFFEPFDAMAIPIPPPEPLGKDNVTDVCCYLVYRHGLAPGISWGFSIDDEEKKWFKDNDCENRVAARRACRAPNDLRLVSSVVHRVFRPNAKIRKMMDSLLQKLDGSFVSVHVRRGDFWKKHDAPICWTNEQITAQINRVLGIHQKISTVFLSSDNSTDVEQITQLLKASSNPKVVTYSWPHRDNSYGLITTALVAAKATVLIGSLSSNMDRFSVEVMAATKWPSFVDLDGILTPMEAVKGNWFNPPVAPGALTPEFFREHFDSDNWSGNRCSRFGLNACNVACGHRGDGFMTCSEKTECCDVPQTERCPSVGKPHRESTSSKK